MTPSPSPATQLSSWIGKDGTERHGLSMVAAEIATTRPR
jgi:hypothetical protein